MATSHRLCPVGLSNNATQEFQFTINGDVYDGFLLVVNEEVVCYINSCPHMGIALNWSPGKFLDINQEFIQCTTHGALFEKSTGHCVSGPCNGSKLIALEIEKREDGWFLIDERVSAVVNQTGYSDNPAGM